MRHIKLLFQPSCLLAKQAGWLSHRQQNYIGILTNHDPVHEQFRVTLGTKLLEVLGEVKTVPIRKFLKILFAVFAVVANSSVAFASSDCRNFVFVKPLPHSKSETKVADWNAFVANIGVDHQEVIGDPANNRQILNFLEAHKDKSNFNRSLLAVARYYGCFSLPKDRTSALEELEISSEEGDPLSIIYLSVQPEYLNDKEMKRRWVTLLKRATQTPLVESARLNLQILDVRQEMKDGAPKGFVRPLRFQRANKKQKKPVKKLCSLSTSAFKIWRQNGIALSGLSACNLHPYGNDNYFDAYKFLVASLSVGYTPSNAQLDQLAWKLGDTSATRSAFKEGFQYSDMDLQQSDLAFLEQHVDRLVKRSNQITAARSAQSSSNAISRSSGGIKQQGHSVAKLRAV